MTTIHERYIVKVPYARARQHLHNTLKGAAEKRELRRLKLTLPLGSGGIEKTVLVTYERGSDPMHFDEPWKVRWTPDGGGPYPDFEGELTVRADETYGSAILELRGEYVPPFGAVGRAFDLVAGAKIAAVTARGLLAAIATEMQARYKLEEAAKVDVAH